MMKKKISVGLFAFAVMTVAGYGLNRSMQRDADLSDMALSNIEALGQNNENSGHKYERREERTVTVIDDTTQTYTSLTIVYCEGTGPLDC